MNLHNEGSESKETLPSQEPSRKKASVCFCNLRA